MIFIHKKHSFIKAFFHKKRSFKEGASLTYLALALFLLFYLSLLFLSFCPGLLIVLSADKQKFLADLICGWESVDNKRGFLFTADTTGYLTWAWQLPTNTFQVTAGSQRVQATKQKGIPWYFYKISFFQWVYHQYPFFGGWLQETHDDVDNFYIR